MAQKKPIGDNRRNVGPRKSKNTFVTKSGQTIKLHRSLADRLRAKKEARSLNKAKRLAGLPKSRFKRILYYMEPRRVAKYWFSREGFIMFLKITGIGIVVSFILLVGVFAYFRKDLPNLRDISGKNIGGSVLYYDKTGKTLLWEDVNGDKRIPVTDDNIPTNIKQATVAVEDKDFFKHGGFDVRGIMRAVFNNVFHKGSTQGGSTITQQLVKLNYDWTKDRTIKRKIKELILSVELERTYSKKEILTGYLNAAPYGGVENGVEAAAENYFHKSAKDLTLDEASMLAAIPKSPTTYSKYSGDYFNKPALLARQSYILDLMVQQHYITKDEASSAKKVDVVAKIQPRPTKFDGIKAPYFVLLAKQQLENEYTDKIVNHSGWKVTTTLDLNLQTLAEQQVAKGYGAIVRAGFDNAAFAAEDVKTGQMVAIVGGVDFNNKDFGQNNYAHWRLPPGSSFKPYDYTSLIENTTNTGAGSVLYDSLGPIPGYPCTNKAQPKQGGNCLMDYDFRTPGAESIRYALGGSRNIPAVKAMLTAGVDKTIGVAQRLGLTSGYKCYQPGVEDVQFAKPSDEGPCYASSAIGDGAYVYLDEHVHAYASLSRNGLNLPQTYILKVVDSSNKVFDEWKPSKGTQAVRPDAAYIVADMMSDPNASYFTNKPHRYKGWKFSLKTGTTNDSKDGWLMGYSTQYAAGVWVGHHTRRVATHAFMETMTQPIWQGWMDAAHANLTPVDRVRPPGVQTLPAYVVRTHIGLGSIEPSPSTDLFPSWYKSGKTSTGVKRTIDIVSNKIATDCTPARARKDITNGDSNIFSSDTFVNQNSATTSDATDDVHSCDDAKPTITLVDNHDGTVTATASAGSKPLSSDQFPMTINFLVGGQISQSSNSNPATFSGHFSSDTDVTAQVIDSVLYDATSNTVTVASGGTNSSPLSLDSAKSTGPTSATFTWSNNKDIATVYNFTTNAVLCSGKNAAATTCSSNTAPAGTKVYAKDTAGGVSSATIVK